MNRVNKGSSLKWGATYLLRFTSSLLLTRAALRINQSNTNVSTSNKTKIIYIYINSIIYISLKNCTCRNWNQCKTTCRQTVNWSSTTEKKCSHFFFQKLGSRSASLLRGDTFASHARRGSCGWVNTYGSWEYFPPTHPWMEKNEETNNQKQLFLLEPGSSLN